MHVRALLTSRRLDYVGFKLVCQEISEMIIWYILSGKIVRDTCLPFTYPMTLMNRRRERFPLSHWLSKTHCSTLSYRSSDVGRLTFKMFQRLLIWYHREVFVANSCFGFSWHLNWVTFSVALDYVIGIFFGIMTVDWLISLQTTLTSLAHFAA